MIYILLLLSVFFTAPFSANAACGTQFFRNADGDQAIWQPTELNGCEYETNNGLYCPGSTRYYTSGYHPYDTLNPVYTSEELEAANYTFDDICEPNIKQEDIPDPNGGDPLGICYRVYHYEEEDRVTGKWSDCLPVSATKPGYHYETTDTFNFTTHISYGYSETGSLDYGEIVANIADCAEYVDIECDGKINGQMEWVSENGGYWSAADCTCNYTTTLNWLFTSKADIACKLKLNPHKPEVNSSTTWCSPTNQREPNEEKCSITQTHACKAGSCIPQNGTQCTFVPDGYYHDNDTDTQCQPCPAGTTSGRNTGYGQGSISGCFLPLETVFYDSNGSFSLWNLGATEDIFYAH